MATIAVETAPEFEARLRAAPWRPPAVPAGTTPIEDREPAANGHIEPWELHSELAFVCPEVRERARELLPERDPDAFLPKRREPVLLPALAVDEVGPSTRLPVAVSAYVLWRLIETARSCLIAVGGVIALAMLAEALH